MQPRVPVQQYDAVLPAMPSNWGLCMRWLQMHRDIQTSPKSQPYRGVDLAKSRYTLYLGVKPFAHINNLSSLKWFLLSTTYVPLEKAWNFTKKIIFSSSMPICLLIVVPVTKEWWSHIWFHFENLTPSWTSTGELCLSRCSNIFYRLDCKWIRWFEFWKAVYRMLGLRIDSQNMHCVGLGCSQCIPTVV